MEFVDCTSCVDCPLHEGAKHPGLPTRPYAVTGKSRALLVVGQSPGFHEDQEGKSWIGYAGKLLSKFLDAASFTNEADIYLSNACRCVVPAENKTQSGHISKCRKWLVEDIRRLSLHYSEIIILACGSPAARSVGKFSSLKTALKHQGTHDSSLSPAETPVDSACLLTCFFTYHPAILHPTRKPALIKAIKAHYDLVSRYLRGQFIPNTITLTSEIGSPPPLHLPPVVSIDIETYGALSGFNQSVFLPIKSLIVDGINYPDQIATVSFAYRNKAGELETPIYVFKNKAHKETLRRWFASISSQNCLLIGQNLKFDLRYLSEADKFLSFYINPLRLRIDDTLLMSFLLYEQRPEKGLKELATLFGITDYTETKKILGHAKNAYDPQLHDYNRTDAASTLVLYEECLSRIAEQYGTNSPKLSVACANLRNTILWDTIELEKNGIAFDTLKLKELNSKIQNICNEITLYLESAGVISFGEGSDASLRKLISDSLKECDLLGDKRVVFTKKQKKIAIKKENIALLLTNIPSDNPHKQQLEKLQTLRAYNKLLNSYTIPLLTNPQKGLTLPLSSRVSLAHPSWYPVPSYHTRSGSEDEKEGGTIQGRFSAQKPSVPTFPPSIVDCLTTRHPSGLLVGYDFSQIELRMAALLSGDPPLLDAYAKGLDLHLQDAPIIFPSLDLTNPDTKNSKERKLLKTLNFLMLYKGGPRKYQETARRDLRLDLSLEFCRETIRQWYKKHHYFKEWQDKLIADVRQKGYIELPTGWSRTFATGSGADVYINEICNYPIQTLSAQLCQSTQFKILCLIHKNNWRTKQVSNNYDSILLDIPSHEEIPIDTIAHKAIMHPPLMLLLEEHFGRTVPINYTKKIYTRYPADE